MQAAKQRHVPFLNHSYQDAFSRLKTLEQEKIDCLPWPAYPYKPAVTFAIAHTTDALLLQYSVREKFIKAATGFSNGPVYQDSCVEFFISFDGAAYYNFEFNCIGTALAAYGKERANRTFLPPETIREIKRQACIKHEEEIAWELAVVIPFSVFIQDDITSLNGKTCSANFYKCGDLLPEPHFLAWSPIASPEPDFHLPKFFGTLLFT